jgi:hypothetical protein
VAHPVDAGYEAMRTFWRVPTVCAIRVVRRISSAKEERKMGTQAWDLAGRFITSALR